jgi:type I restriction-modification system DNA methylase subunit
MNKENSKKIIAALIEKYKKVIDEKRLSTYNEEMTKKDFILPLFRELGWGIEDSNEVTAEEKISKKRVDYGFKINGIPKFFLEAKKLKEDLMTTKFVEQAIDYSWNKGCSWAVLTNFENLTIFNAEWKAETPWYNRFKTFNYNEYLDRFDELWLLSKASFEKTVIDKEAEKVSKKVKKTSVDKQLLFDFTRFRELLSKNITKLNQNLNVSEYELDESVQRILDRLIFIRNCEDRELEPRILIANYREWDTKGKGQLIKSLRDTFKLFDTLYNSKIFAEHLCDKLNVDNDVLREIIEGLYYTKDKSVSYDFSAIDADILGTIYEQYLGHILKKTEKRATLKENHAHRKEQGIYYTPPYIVNYIVKNTLGNYLENTKNNIDQIRILDPACGSGSFLIKAYDILNEYQSKNDATYHQAELDFKTDTIFTKKAKILQNNIFGVDLDKQAVEIAQLNLLLKIAEKKKRLPLLGENIKCGNSLIADEKYAGDKAFTWEEEFAEIFKEGGFDVIIGNPPYVRQEEFGEIKPYLESNYETYQGTADLFVYFFEKELKLLKENGFFGMVVSNKWLRGGYGKNLRKFLTKFWIEELIDFGDLKVFADATIYPCIIIMKKIEKLNPKIRICKMETLDFGSLEEYIKNNSFFINQSDLSEKEWNIQKSEGNELIKKIRMSGILLEEYVSAKINYGIKTGLNEAFIINENKREELISDDLKSEELIKPYLTGAELKRYIIKSKKNYIILTKIGVGIEKYSVIYKYLYNYKEALEKRWDKGKYWYELRACAYYNLFGKPKIVWGNLATRSSFSLDETNGFYVNAPACILPTDSKYVLGVLNSKLMSYFLLSICAERQGGFVEQKPVYVSQVPIKKPTEMQEIDMIKLVEKMLLLNDKLLRIGDKLTDERAGTEEEITKVDRQIDELVYTIYDISRDEKEIIEQS